MEIKVNDYVRTNKGTIDKITDKNIMTYQVALMGFGEKPIKSSPRIIDLIEVGDYVNDVIVTQSYIDNIKHIAPEIKENNYGIKSIVTKEQFEQMEYKLEKE